MNKIIIDLAAGEQAARPLTPEEEAQRLLDEQAAAAAAQAELDAAAALEQQWVNLDAAINTAGSLSALKTAVRNYLKAIPK